MNTYARFRNNTNPTDDDHRNQTVSKYRSTFAILLLDAASLEHGAVFLEYFAGCRIHKTQRLVVSADNESSDT
jgi:hypothetical protein